MGSRAHVPMVEVPGAAKPGVPTEEEPAFPEDEGMGVPIRRALISVSDKEGLEEFARALADQKIEIIATPGTFEYLQGLGIPVTHIEQITGASDALDGRVKTLDRDIHLGIQADRDDPGHVRYLEESGIRPIDLVCVNLKPFDFASFTGTHEEAIENIDIGGSAMLRAAAKNYRSAVAVSSRFEYDRVLEELRGTGEISANTSRDLAAVAFDYSSQYDGQISKWLKGRSQAVDAD